LKHASDFLDVVDRYIADDFAPRALLDQLAGAYRRAPFFAETLPVIEQVVGAAPRNLFEYLHHSIAAIAAHLEIRTPLVVSSTVPIDHGLKAEQRVLALCGALGATRYVGDAAAAYPQLASLPCVWDRTPTGAAVAQLALAGSRADVLVTGAPAYIRLAEAEILYPDGVPGALRKRPGG